jgi:hypothetical protein
MEKLVVDDPYVIDLPRNLRCDIRNLHSHDAIARPRGDHILAEEPAVIS